MRKPWGGLSLPPALRLGVLRTLQEKGHCGNGSETDGEVAFHGGEREDPFRSYGLSRNLSKSVRATSLSEDVLPGMQHVRSLSAMFPAPSPPL